MRSLRLFAPLAVCALVITGCAKAKAPQAEALDKAATVIPVAGTTRLQVRLTPDAVRRLDIQTGTVHDAPVASRPTGPVDGSPVPASTTTVRRVIPFSAVLYAPTGEAFTYTVAGPQLYERVAMVIDYVAGDLAVLSSGPTAGTSVVTVGGPELIGAELGTGE